MAVLQIRGNRFDERGRLHSRDQMVEKALLVAFERASGRGLGLGVQGAGLARHIGGFERCVQILVDDLKSVRIGVVDADLLRRKRVLDDLDLDTLVRQGARGIEAQRFEVAGQDFHGGDAARLDGGDKIGPRSEGKIVRAPKAEPLRVGQIGHGRGAGGRDIDDAGRRQRVLQPKARLALLRGGLDAAFALFAGGVGHGVGLVEEDDALEILG